MKDKELNKCYFSVLRFKDKAGLGLTGMSKYDQVFLEELEVHKTKNTDLAKQMLSEFCLKNKLPYKLQLIGKDLADIITIYEPKR